jgi:hypothetical protein
VLALIFVLLEPRYAQIMMCPCRAEARGRGKSTCRCKTAAAGTHEERQIYGRGRFPTSACSEEAHFLALARGTFVRGYSGSRAPLRSGQRHGVCVLSVRALTSVAPAQARIDVAKGAYRLSRDSVHALEEARLAGGALRVRSGLGYGPVCSS